MHTDSLYSLERAKENTEAYDRDAALSHLMHDAGDVAKELCANGRVLAVAENILAQRKGGAGLYQLNFSSLGANEEQLERIARHQAERKTLEAEFAQARETMGAVPSFTLPPRTVTFTGSKRSPLDHATRPATEQGRSA